MPDERELAHAIIALADSASGIGGALREVIAGSGETNRILAAIHDQNGRILDQMEHFTRQQSDSEREIRVLKSTVKRHDESLVAIQQAIGLPLPAE